MAYYGILMKDGTELTHYGVKGMKWGKRLFGKVKGAFGKPTMTPQQEAQEAAKRNAAKSSRPYSDASASRYRSGAQNAQRLLQDAYRRIGTGRSVSSSANADENKWALTRMKQNSKRINGR